MAGNYIMRLIILSVPFICCDVQGAKNSVYIMPVNIPSVQFFVVVRGAKKSHETEQ